MISQPDLSKPVYDHLKKMIQSGQLKPGLKLVQEDLAKQLGVSRTPLLKALQNLEHEMLVESKPRRGMFVKEVSLKEMIDVYDCREGIECTAVRLAIERSSTQELKKLRSIFEPFLSQDKIDFKKYTTADERFHNSIINQAKNPVLTRMSNLSTIQARVYDFGLIRKPEETLLEHLNIIEAVVSKDIALAVQAMRTHISLSKNILVLKLENEK